MSETKTPETWNPHWTIHTCFCHRGQSGWSEYFQAEQICSIGSGTFESAVKQIDRRLQISGAQWKQEHVPQVLAHRCAYLNDLITI